MKGPEKGMKRVRGSWGKASVEREGKGKRILRKRAMEREGKDSEDEKRTGTRREKVQRMMRKGQGHGGKTFR